jgi:hypothetical protein
MTATLELELGERLTADELHELTALAVREGKTLERLLFEGAREVVRRRHDPQLNLPLKTDTPATT